MPTNPKDTMELIGRGRTADVYAWSDNQVLKLFFDWCPPEWIQREVHVGQMLLSTSLPTPRIMDTVSIDGRQGIIFERVEGPSMLNLLASKPWVLLRMARRFADLQSSIHKLEGSDLFPVLDQLEVSISSSEALPVSIRERALSTLADLPVGEALCHFDFHPDQVVITNQGPKVLDWMTACQGHPLADVARTYVLVRFG